MVQTQAKMAPPSLKRNTAVAFAGHLVYMSSQWLTLIVLAKYADLAQLGQFAFALAVTSPIYMFSNMQLRTVQATDSRDQFRFDEYLLARLCTTAISLMAVLTIVAVLGKPHSYLLLVGLVAASKSIECITDVVHGLFQRYEQLPLVAMSCFLHGFHD